MQEIQPFVARPRQSIGPSSEASGEALAETEIQRRVLRSEFGVLAPLISDPAVTDVFFNGARHVWVDRGAGLEQHPQLIFSEEELREFAVRLVSLGGRHIDEANPCVDAKLGGGIRVHAVLPPISIAGTHLSLRIPRPRPLSLDDLDAAGFFSLIPMARIHELVDRRDNILISGAAGSGKTTLLAAILSAAPEHERIVAIEDVAELQVHHPHFVALEARQANLEGAGGIGLARLVREALRMRPDRLVVGECRGAEVRELLGALNTGHDGGAGTVHANSLGDVPARLEALGALADLGPTAIARQTVSAIGRVLHVERKDGARRLAQMGCFSIGPRDRLIVREVV